MTALVMGAFVYAFGPGIHDYAAFCENLQLNWFKDRCVPIPVAAYSSPGWLHPDTLEFRVEPFEDAFYVAPLDHLSFAHALPKLTWLKLDVEGAEFQVLLGAMGLILTHKPKILVEHHLFKGAQIRDQCNELLATLGYKLESEMHHHAVSHALYIPI